MVGPEHVGSRVRIKASDDFYAFVDGKTGLLHAFDSGHAVVRSPSEEFPESELTFLVPPDQLELIP